MSYYKCKYCNEQITKSPEGWFDSSRGGRNEKYSRWCVGSIVRGQSPDKLHYPCKEDIVKRLLSKIK